MSTDVQNNDKKFNGLVDMASASSVLYKPNSINNADIGSTAAVAATKLLHRHRFGTNFALAIGGTPAAREEVVWIATEAGSIKSVSAMLNDTGTSTDVDFDLKVNGVSVLSAAINITNATSDRAQVDGTISSASYSDGDVISMSLAVTSSTGAQGPYMQCEVETAAA